jgi:hypothetical protein
LHKRVTLFLRRRTAQNEFIISCKEFNQYGNLFFYNLVAKAETVQSAKIMKCLLQNLNSFYKIFLFGGLDAKFAFIFQNSI